MDAAQELGALDELPEATVALLAVGDAAGSVVDYANRCASVVARVPAGELIGHRVRDATASEAGEVLIAVGEACANAIEHAGAPGARAGAAPRRGSGCCGAAPAGARRHRADHAARPVRRGGGRRADAAAAVVVSPARRRRRRA